MVSQTAAEALESLEIDYELKSSLWRWAVAIEEMLWFIPKAAV